MWSVAQVNPQYDCFLFRRLNLLRSVELASGVHGQINGPHRSLVRTFRLKLAALIVRRLKARWKVLQPAFRAITIRVASFSLNI